MEQIILQEPVINEVKKSNIISIYPFKRYFNTPDKLTIEQKEYYKILFPIFQNTKYEYGKSLDKYFPSVITDLILNMVPFSSKHEFPQQISPEIVPNAHVGSERPLLVANSKLVKNSLIKKVIVIYLLDINIEK